MNYLNLIFAVKMAPWLVVENREGCGDVPGEVEGMESEVQHLGTCQQYGRLPGALRNIPQLYS